MPTIEELCSDDGMYDQGIRLGLDADFYPVVGHSYLVAAVDNDGGPCIYIVPAGRLYVWLSALDEGTEHEAVWEGIAALAAYVDLTVRPGEVHLGH